MLALMKRHRLWPPLALALLSLAAALAALWLLGGVPAHYQYLWPAPAPLAAAQSDATQTVRNAGLREARLRMDAFRETLSGACEPVTLFAVLDGVSVIADRDNAQAATARLEALNDGAFALKPLLLKGGRLLYPDEMRTGQRVALVDEKLAVALFNYAEPLERYLLLDGERYRIVGIVNDRRQVGDHSDYSLYIPYRAAENSGLTLTALCIQTQPVPGSGGWAAFESATAALGKQGTAISLTKERMNAVLPLRVVGCLFGFLALVFGLQVLAAQSVRLYRAFRLRLREQYALRLTPWLVLRALPLALGYALCAVAFARLFMVLVEPVYTFPEWIPKVLVEPNDIATAFWDVWQRQATVLTLRSPELLRAHFVRTLMGWACGTLALAGGLLAGRLGATLRGRFAPPQPLPEGDAPSVETPVKPSAP